MKSGNGGSLTGSLSSNEVYSKALDRLAENERHFHNIQAGIRGLASTWMLAAFGRIALLLKQQKGVTWQFHPLGLAVVICVMANVGLSVLWIIDQPVSTTIQHELCSWIAP
jgi:hypothetical protein